jgi:hypothetical protein
MGTAAYQVRSTTHAAQTAPGSGGVLAWALVVYVPANYPRAKARLTTR